MTTNKINFPETDVEKLRGYAQTYNGIFGTKEHLSVNNMSGSALISIIVKDDDGEGEDATSAMILPLDVASRLAIFIIGEFKRYEQEQHDLKVAGGSNASEA